MTARISCLLLASAALAFSASGMAQQTKPDTGPTMHVTVMGAKGVQFKKLYRDASGKPISEVQFMKAVQAGSDFAPALDPVAKTVTLTLKAGNRVSDTAALRPGQTLPDFKLPTVAHAEATPGQLLGKPALVDFFFADCVPCMQEVPALNAYAASHPDMHVLAITFDDAKTASAFVSKRHFRWPVAYGSQPLNDKLQVRDYPTLLLLDAKGRLLAMRSGGIPATGTSTHAESASQVHWLQHWVSGKLADASQPPKVVPPHQTPR